MCPFSSAAAAVLLLAASDSSWPQDNCDVVGLKSALLDGSYLCCSTAGAAVLVAGIVTVCIFWPWRIHESTAVDPGSSKITSVQQLSEPMELDFCCCTFCSSITIDPYEG